MYSPPKRFAIGLLAVIAACMMIQDTSAQSASQYEARLKAMRAARERAQQAQVVQQASYEQGVDYTAPPMPTQPPARMARLPRQVNTRGRTAPRNYRPQHLRTAQLSDGQIAGGGAPIVSEPTPITPQVSAPVYNKAISTGCGPGCGGCSSCASTGTVYEGVVEETCTDGCGAGCGVGGCGINGLLCGRCYSCSPLDVPCSDRGGCPPMAWEDCWLSIFGRIFAEGEYFAGAHAFKGPAFAVPGGVATSDDNFGLYGGANFSAPLCRLTCGLFSGQIGIRSSQSDFNGSQFTPDTRDQTFVTAGLFRRVDYGLQAGIAFDWLHEEWFSEVDVSQIRGDIGWLYGNGSSFGFRFAQASEDDVTSGVFNNTVFTNMTTTAVDQYRFYYRRECVGGGFTELTAGWAEGDYTNLGFHCDMPIAERLAVQTGLNYFIAEETANVGGTDADAWNIFMGFTFRPRGRSWYKYYDRPMFDVADNGTFLLSRQ